MHITDNIWLEDIHIAIERNWLSIHIALHEYGLLEKRYNHKDVFDIITHFILKDMCDQIIAGLQLGTKTVLYLNTNYNLRESEYIGYSQDTLHVISRLEKLIPSVIPAYLIKRPYQLYHDFTTKYKHREVEVVYEIDKIKQKYEKNAFKLFNLNKIIQYLNKRGLKYLSTDYFLQVNNKLIAANK